MFRDPYDLDNDTLAICQRLNNCKELKNINEFHYEWVANWDRDELMQTVYIHFKRLSIDRKHTFTLNEREIDSGCEWMDNVIQQIIGRELLLDKVGAA